MILNWKLLSSFEDLLDEISVPAFYFQLLWETLKQDSSHGGLMASHHIKENRMKIYVHFMFISTHDRKICHLETLRYDVN